MADESVELVWFRRVCRFIALFPLVLGGTVALTGTTGFEVLFGVEVGDIGPTLESAVRFLATTFVGMGAVLLWASGDVVGRSGAIQIFFVAMVAGAAARIIGAVVGGAPNIISIVLIAIELTGFPMWLWHRRILAARRSR